VKFTRKNLFYAGQFEFSDQYSRNDFERINKRQVGAMVTDGKRKYTGNLNLGDIFEHSNDYSDYTSRQYFVFNIDESGRPLVDTITYVQFYFEIRKTFTTISWDKL